MDDSNYVNSIQVKAEAKTAYTAITQQIKSWWTDTLEGSAANKGDVFTVRFGTTYMTFSVEELVQDKKIVWKCTDAFTDVPSIRDKKEWVGTKISFEISGAANENKITLTHFGLDAFFECYDICVKGWNQFFGESLALYLNENKGNPYLNKSAVV